MIKHFKDKYLIIYFEFYLVFSMSTYISYELKLIMQLIGVDMVYEPAVLVHGSTLGGATPKSAPP